MLLWSEAKSWQKCRELIPIYAHLGLWITQKLSKIYRYFLTKTKFLIKEMPYIYYNFYLSLKT